ncbi:hypothetical protein [Flavobacterium selenitireducens]|uniref:hypothetical protein n=1 Tax=Flavobacterium selenitireducens TaxID=2722704 RepID=UPI00168B87E6|nr:hypothetical protein [Flavobacterium selenitireducens]MBD3582485.1 hypothetical protein [Flavobacterium selenitireducens]
MKKLVMLASAAVLALSLNSCSSDDNGGGGVSDAKLVGKWAHETERVVAGGQVLQPEQPYSDNEAGCAKDFIQFGETGAFTYGDYWSSECDLDTDVTTWTRDGKDITVGEGTEAETFTVMSVSATKLKVKYVTTLQGVNFTEELTFSKVD